MNFNYEQIEQYIDGTLTGEALANFEAKLLTDKTLAEEVALYKDVDVTLASAYAYKEEDAALEQTFNQMGKKYFTKEATIQEADSAKTKQDNTKVIPLQPRAKENEDKKPSGLRWLRPVIGLVAAALIALFIWIGNVIQPFDEPYQLAVIERSGSKQMLEQAQKAYNSGDYASALPVFEKYTGDEIEVQIAKGNAEFYLGKIDAAVNTLEKVVSRNSVYTPTANWYLAGAYLEQNEPKKAKAALGKIPEGAKKYYTKAQKLLRKIE